MKDKIFWKTANTFDNKKFKNEYCSVKDFISHFKDEELWAEHITESK